MAIEESVGESLREREAFVAAAESCTGGLIGSLLTDVPGSSDYFDRSVVTYSYDAKLDLGVPRELLDSEGAVSEPVARAMARGVRDSAGVRWGVATTGIAGPAGGSDEKPVGTVYIAIAHAGEWGSGESWCRVGRYVFGGDRTEIKRKIAHRALEDLRDAVESAYSSH
ncbi:CinA family protein [Natronomonas sp. LN261]|jgi:nicotinamide-nucleotide amidase|uniref:CinA family protein n=1 Tax=Natronomonas sp. LN261 TaxID=2750669 RepID=UPI0015EF6B2A|nr:CinA family protein [Natronomonas sp. LN261]